MAHPSVTINGIVYASCPEVDIPKSGGGTCVRFKGNNHTLTVYTGNKSTSSYGFPPDTELQYIVIYSS